MMGDLTRSPIMALAADIPGLRSLARRWLALTPNGEFKAGRQLPGRGTTPLPGFSRIIHGSALGMAARPRPARLVGALLVASGLLALPA